MRFIRLAAVQPEPDRNLLTMLHGVVAHHAYGADGIDVTDPELRAVRDDPMLRAALAAPHEDWVDERFDTRRVLRYLDGAERDALAWWSEAYA